MSDRLTSCGTSGQTTTREGALARLRYWCARRPAVAAAARRGLALYQLDMACFAARRRGREMRRVDGNPHYRSPPTINAARRMPHALAERTNATVLPRL